MERITYRIENNFFLTVIRHGLTLMIPVILAGGVACAFMNLPFVDYSKAIGGFDLMLLHSFLEMIYQGTFGVFSMVLVIVPALSYGMERNETVDKVAMYIIVALGSYGVQLNIGGEDFNVGNLGVQGCFTAMFIALFSCYFYQKLRNVAILSLRKYAVGMESLCANAIQSLLPMAVVILMAATFAKVLHLCFGFYNLHELFAFYSCKLFENMGNLAKIGSFTVIFNLNEVLNFGLPIILNPVMAIPFILTPILCYSTAYLATTMGLVPTITREIVWSTPPLISGYMATGSIRGSLLQLVCILMGMAVYFPFIRLHKQVQEVYSREKLKVMVKEFQEEEIENEEPRFLGRMDSYGLISRMLLEDLKLAIERDELFMVYQPQVNEKGECVGGEALLRWHHPLYGIIYTPLIIYLAKEGNLLPQLEEKIFDIASAAIKRISEEYDGDFKVSVNITAKSLLWDIESCIKANLEKHGITAEQLWIEITEQDVISNADHVIDKLERMKDCGHVLLIDDFGMGHTSLIYLQSNYFGVVKLDGSLVKKILDNETNQKIIASIVELGNELGIKVIAEYVETREEWQMLMDLGCFCYQGFLFSKPVELDDFIKYIKKQS